MLTATPCKRTALYNTQRHFRDKCGHTGITTIFVSNDITKTAEIFLMKKHYFFPTSACHS
jgi:hypothetical protein